jgi:hypothetical protein
MGNFQVVKVASGETIQIRTGVLQGIGAQGPTGPIGPAGPVGDQGPQGDTGPMGQISSFSSELTIGGSTALGSGTPGPITFDTTVRDDLAVVTSGTTFTAPEGMDLFFSVWVRFNLPADSADGYRMLTLRTGASFSTIVHAVNVPAVVGIPTDVSFTTTFKAAEAQAFQIWGSHNDSLSVATGSGRLAIYRVGSGPAGEAGPEGPVGPVGPVGPAGPAGPDGSATTGFATYADLLP